MNLRKHVSKVHPGKVREIVPIIREQGNGEYLCSFCGKRFTKECFLKFHERYHSVDKKLNCPLCDISIPSKKRLYHHLAMNHDVSIESEETDDKTLNCPLCDISVPSKKYLYHHLAMNHDVSIESEETEDKKFTCSECGRKYNYRGTLKQHVLKVHPGKVRGIVPIIRKQGNGEYLCSFCGKRFTRESLLKYHERNNHSVDRNNRKMNCPLCDISVASKKRLYHHLAINHDVSIESEETEFESFEDFWVWKQQIEINTLSRYVKRHASLSLSDNATRHFFACHRSGRFLSKSKGIRRLKETVKIGGVCPSSIEVTEAQDGSCKVKYIVTHIGHQNVDHVSLTETERDEENILAELSRENIEPSDLCLQKEKMRQTFENLLDTISSAKQMEVLKRHLSTLNASLAAVDSNEGCQQNGPCNAASRGEQNVQPQRRVLSTRKRRKIVHHFEKPCTTEAQEINISPLKDIPVSDGVFPGGSKQQLPTTQHNTLVPVIDGVQPGGSKPRQLAHRQFILVPVNGRVWPGGSKSQQLAPDQFILGM